MEPSRCPQCGSPLAHGVLQGQCPRCLAALAFGNTTAASTAPLPSIGSGDLEIVRELGRGGMGIVFEARQRSLNRLVAVKTLRATLTSDAAWLERFRGEAMAAARLDHPGIVRIHGFDELHGQPCLVMERVDGPCLAELVRDRALAAPRAARYLRLAAQAVAHAHQSGILHCDLKPSNILVDAEDLPRLTDFGLARVLDARTGVTRCGELLGSPNYLPPEVVAGSSPSPATDIYALGAILYELLTSRPPFMADSIAATLHSVVDGPLVPPRALHPGIPADLETICLKCLQRDPTRRYASAREVAEDLERFESGQPIRARPVSALEQWWLWCRRKPALAAVSLALALALLIGATGIVAQWRQAESGRRELAEHLYAADVAAAATALQDGNLGRARRLLHPHVQEPRIPPEFTARLLQSRTRGDELAVLGSLPWIVSCLAISADGEWLAAGGQADPNSSGPTVRVWNLRAVLSGTAAPAIPTIATSNTVWSLAFTSDGKTLITAGDLGAQFWHFPSGNPDLSRPSVPARELALAGSRIVYSPNHPFRDAAAPHPLGILDLNSGSAHALPVHGRHPTLSRDGRWLAWLDADRNVMRMELTPGSTPQRVATNHLVFRLHFSPDGRHLAAAGRMTAAKVWDLQSPDAPSRVFRSRHNVWDAAFLPHARTLITATSHPQLELWDTVTTEPRGTLQGHDDEVWCVVSTPDGRHLISGGKDRSVRLWTATPKRQLNRVPHHRELAPAFSRDGTRLLTASPGNQSGEARLWALREQSHALLDTGAIPRASANEIILGFSTDELHLLGLDPTSGLLRRHAIEPPRDLPLRAPTPLVGFTNWIGGAALSRIVLAADGRWLVAADRVGKLRAWSTETGLPSDARPLPPPPSPRPAAAAPRALALSRAGRWAALSSYGTPHGILIDLTVGTTVSLNGHADDIAAFAFSSDETLLASASVDGTVRLWRLPEGAPLGALPGHSESVEAVAFSPDQRTLAALVPGVQIVFWHLPTRRELARIPHPDVGRHLAFSPDGRRLAIGTTQGNLETDTDFAELWDAPSDPVPVNPNASADSL